MSENLNLTKSQRKRLKRAEKRKASESPSIENASHDVSNERNSTGITSTDAASVKNTQDPRVYSRVDYGNQLNDSEGYVRSVLNFNTTPTMDTGQHIPLSYQTPPPHYGQYGRTPGVFASTPVTGMTEPPSWAIPLIEDVRMIKTAVPKIREIEQSVKSINLKISDIDGKITGLEKKIIDIENSVSFINHEHEEQKSGLSKTKGEVEKLKKICDDLEKTVEGCKQKEETATEKLLDLEYRSMRDNLIFYGLPESQQPGSQRTMEDCEKLVKELITTKLQLDSSKMEFDRAHRLGGTRARRPRPIVVKFHRYHDRETVRLKAQDETTKTALRDSNLGVGVQTPLQYREARKALAEYAKREGDRGQRTKILGNKLFVGGKPVKKFVDGSVVDC